MDSMFTLGVVLSAKDMLSPAMGKAGQSVSKLSSKIQAASGKMAILGTASYAAGRAMLSPVTDTINAYQDLAKVQGDIASLGISAKGIDTITKSAKEFSNQFAGVTANEFVAASYDIKSGIASLSDEGVAKFTKLSAMTARATKSSAAEMTKLFALGYGIFKNSKETDFDFGERMSAQVAQAVKSFRTDGSDLTLGISNIGAQAKKMGVSLAEELAIIGNAKGAFNSASEAATGYRAFLDGTANAQKKLGLTFTDAEGKMLPMVDILAKIKEKYGDNLGSLAVQKELKDAFGSSEAVKIVNALVDQTDQLTKSQKELNNATLENTEIMAKERNKGHEFEILNNQVTNLSTTIGQMFAPVVRTMSSVLGSVIKKVQSFASEHKTATKVIAYGVAAFGALLTVAGAVLIPIAAIGMALPAVAAGFGAVSVAAEAMGVAMKNAFGPIGIIISAVAFAAYMIYDNWEPISKWFVGMWNGFKSMLSSVWSYMKKAFSWSPLGLVVKGYGAMFDWLSSKFEWFRSAAQTMGDIGSSIAGFFGFGGDSKIEVSKTVASSSSGTTKTAPVIGAKPTGSSRNNHVNNISTKTASNNSYAISVNVQSGDPREIAHHVKRVVKEMESSRKNRSFNDEEI